MIVGGPIGVGEGFLAHLHRFVLGAQAGGLGDQVSSWLSANASNLPVSADQLKAVLGDEHITQIASAMGLSTDQIAETLAEHLPALAAAQAG